MSESTLEPISPALSVPTPPPTSSRTAIHADRLHWWAIGVVVVGLVIRLAISSVSIGSNDAPTWAKFGADVAEHGLGPAYLRDRLLNHPTPPTLWAWGAHQIAGSNLVRFAFLMRLPAIVADGLSCWLLWRIVFPRLGTKAAFQSVALMALSPLMILVSGYHCNTDSVYVSLTLLAIFYAERLRFTAGGLAMAAALNVKIIPVLLAPAFFVFCRRHQKVMLFGAMVSLAILPFLIPAATTQFRSLRNIFGYGSQPEYWGVMYILMLLGDVSPAWIPFENLSWQYFERAGRWIMLATIGISMIRLGRDTKPDIVRLAAVSSAWFAVLAPGFGVQYLIFPVTLILAYSPRWGLYAAAFSSLFAVFIYAMFLDRVFPFRSHFITPFVTPCGEVGLLAWGVFLMFAVRTSRLTHPAKAVPGHG